MAPTENRLILSAAAATGQFTFGTYQWTGASSGTWTGTGTAANPYIVPPTTFPPFAPLMTPSPWVPSCSCNALGYEIPDNTELTGFCMEHGALRVTQIKVY